MEFNIVKKGVKIVFVQLVVFVLLSIVFKSMESTSNFLEGLPWYSKTIRDVLFIGFIIFIFKYFEK